MANPFALLTLSVVACLLWLAVVVGKESFGQTHSVILDQDHKQFARPRTARKRSALTVVMIVVVAILVSYGTRRYYVVTHTAAPRPVPNPPSGLRAGATIDSPMFLEKGNVFKLSKSVMPCAGKRIGYGVDGLNTMRGPGSKKPWLVVEATRYQFIDWTGDDSIDLLFQVEVTNRGEPSIVKGWELCLVAPDKSIRRYHAEEISPVDLARLGGNSISFAEGAFTQPIEHGRAITGWISFHIPRDVVKPETLTGSLQCRDYLDHLSEEVFSTKPPKPVPQAAQPEAKPQETPRRESTHQQAGAKKKVIKSPEPVPAPSSQNCPNGICIGGENNGVAQVNNFGPPPVQIKLGDVVDVVPPNTAQGTGAPHPPSNLKRRLLLP